MDDEKKKRAAAAVRSAKRSARRRNTSGSSTGSTASRARSAASAAWSKNDAYCPDILVQSAAAGAALNAFNKELLASHIRTCVVEDIRDGKDEVIDELVATLQKLMK